MIRAFTQERPDGLNQTMYCEAEICLHRGPIVQVKSVTCACGAGERSITLSRNTVTNRPVEVPFVSLASECIRYWKFTCSTCSEQVALELIAPTTVVTFTDIEWLPEIAPK